MRENMTHALEKTGYVDQKIVWLRSRRWWQRLEAASKLGVMRSPRAVPALLEASRDPVEEVRLAAVRSLGEMSETRGLPELFRAM